MIAERVEDCLQCGEIDQPLRPCGEWAGCCDDCADQLQEYAQLVEDLDYDWEMR